MWTCSMSKQVSWQGFWALRRSLFGPSCQKWDCSKNGGTSKSTSIQIIYHHSTLNGKTSEFCNQYSRNHTDLTIVLTANQSICRETMRYTPPFANRKKQQTQKHQGHSRIWDEKRWNSYSSELWKLLQIQVRADHPFWPFCWLGSHGVFGQQARYRSCRRCLKHIETAQNIHWVLQGVFGMMLIFWLFIMDVLQESTFENALSDLLSSIECFSHSLLFAHCLAIWRLEILDHLNPFDPCSLPWKTVPCSNIISETTSDLSGDFQVPSRGAHPCGCLCFSPWGSDQCWDVGSGFQCWKSGRFQ